VYVALHRLITHPDRMEIIGDATKKASKASLKSTPGLIG
jgi:hypothetical protein